MRQNGETHHWQDDLRAALRHLWDPDRLSQSPLAELEVVRQRAAGRAGGLPAPLDQAQALRQVLTEALESLRPPGPPQPRDRRWQHYRLLRDAYWQGQDNETVRRQLFLSRTTFYREQQHALAALAQALADLARPTSAVNASLAGGETLPIGRDFVGRQAELAHYDALLDGQGWAVIEGLPGVGKTALGAALASRRATREKAFWYTFRPGLNDDAPAVTQALAAFAGQPGDATDAQALGPTVTCLLAELGRRPTLLCFDDVHAGDDDPAVRSLLAALWQRARQRQFTLLLISRQRPAFVTEPTGPALGGLSPADTAALLERLRASALPADLCAALHERTQGNPQLLRLFAAGLSGRPPAPDAVAELSRQRVIYAYLLDHVWRTLTAPEQEILQTLAVCRVPLRYETALALLDQPGRDVPASLYDLVDRHILEETSDDRALVVHPLVRDFCIDLLSQAARAKLHRRIAVIYEDAGDALTAAHHYLAAGEPRLAARLLVAQVQPLLDAGQVGPLARLLVALPAGPGEGPLDEWVAARIALGQVQARLGDDEAALATFDALLAALQSRDDAAARRGRARAYAGLADVYEQQGDNAAALAALQQGLAQIEREDEPGLAGQLLARQARALSRQGQYEPAIAACERGLALLPAEGLDDVVGEVYRTLGAVYHDRGDLAQAIAYTETALWASRRAGDAPGQIHAHQLLAGYYAERGDYEAGEHARQVRLLRGHVTGGDLYAPRRTP